MPAIVERWIISYDNCFNDGMQDSLPEWITMVVHMYPRWVHHAKHVLKIKHKGNVSKYRSTMALWWSNDVPNQHPMKQHISNWNFLNKLIMLVKMLHPEMESCHDDDGDSDGEGEATAGGSATDVDFSLLATFKDYWENHVDSTDPENPINCYDLVRMGYMLKESLRKSLASYKGKDKKTLEPCLFLALWKFAVQTDPLSFSEHEDAADTSAFKQAFTKYDSNTEEWLDKLLTLDMSGSETLKVAKQAMSTMAVPGEEKAAPAGKSGAPSTKIKKPVGDSRKKQAMKAISGLTDQTPSYATVICEILSFCSPEIKSQADVNEYITVVCAAAHVIFRFSFEVGIVLACKEFKKMSLVCWETMALFSKHKAFNDAEPSMADKFKDKSARQIGLELLANIKVTDGATTGDAGGDVRSSRPADDGSVPVVLAAKFDARDLETLQMFIENDLYQSLRCADGPNKALKIMFKATQPSKHVPPTPVGASVLLGHIFDHVCSTAIQMFALAGLREMSIGQPLPQELADAGVEHANSQDLSCYRTRAVIYILQALFGESRSSNALGHIQCKSWIGSVSDNSIQSLAASDVGNSVRAAFVQFWKLFMEETSESAALASATAYSPSPFFQGLANCGCIQHRWQWSASADTASLWQWRRM